MRLITSPLLIALSSTTLWSADWPQFRGPDGQGHSDAKNIPIEWSETKNITWKVPVPGRGYSSLVIAGNQI